VIVEGSNDQYKITDYCLPKRNGVFENNEVRNIFLAQTMDNPVYEDSEREILSQYLVMSGIPLSRTPR
jgi:hypothetical protein